MVARTRALLALGAALIPGILLAQSPGLRVFQSIGNYATQLVDNQGNLVHQWAGGPSLIAHVDADGSLLRGAVTGAIVVPGATGRIERLSFDGTVLWSYDLSGPFHYAHHDIEPMPNGNVLVIAWDRYTDADAIANGRNPAFLSSTDWLPDAILEIEPTGPTTGNVVWEWHMRDHVIQDFDPSKPNYGVVANHPELLDINYPPAFASAGDWNHFNGLDYDPINDWIIVSSHSQNELYLIDHSTTTAEAAGHTGGQRGKGGDFLYRWGNPEAYRAGTGLDRQLGGQHDPRFVPPGFPGAGHVTVFNNQYQLTQSAVFELELPVDAQGQLSVDPTTGRFGPTAPFWSYTDPTMLSPIVSGAERLLNGNTLICSGSQNLLLEVTPNGQTVWSYFQPNSQLIFQSSYVERSLWADTRQLSVTGGQIDFHPLFGSGHAGEIYLLLGSASGTAPGTTLPGGVILPLNFDYLSGAMAAQFNTGMFQNTIGLLNTAGGGSSSIGVPPGARAPALAGLQLHFAYAVFDSALAPVWASNAVPVTIVP